MSFDKWKYRNPPKVENINFLKLCLMPDTCIYNEKCENAHSKDELEEWKKRLNFKQKAIKYNPKELKEELLDLRNEILKRICQENSEEVINEKDEQNERSNVLVELTGWATIRSNQSLFVMHVEKEKELHWVFSVTIPTRPDIEPKMLKRIFLMGICPKFSFTYVYTKTAEKLYEMPSGCSIWENKEGSTGDVIVNLAFSSKHYGNFQEEVIFDFGDFPKVSRKVGVQVSNEDILKKIMDFDPEENIENEIAWLSKYEGFNFNGEIRPAGITTKFPLPKNVKTLVQFDAFKHLDVRLTKQNYRQRLHTLLFVEEFERRAELQSYNFMISDFKECIEELPGDIYQASIQFDEFAVKRLMKLVGINGKMLIRFYEYSNDVKVYEASIKHFTAENLILNLSKHCYNLIKQSKVPVKIDACFCLFDVFEPLHYSIDNIKMKHIFPNLSHYKSLPIKPVISKEDTLSLDQYRAVKIITEDKPKPPVLLLGPFGTGKTKTLAHIVKELITTSSDEKRILICTHSNSAADVFIEEYFHPFHEFNSSNFNDKLIPLRINWTHRYQNAVSDKVLAYCLVDYNTGLFKEATKDDLDSHYLIICTLYTAFELVKLDLPENYFTHIFIDEAAQAMESECIIPLLMAGPETTVVLSGDHLQIGEELLSETARNLDLGMSLLERLYNVYETGSEYKLQLIENFRSYEEIVNMASKLFYNKTLLSNKKRPAGTPYPVQFFQVDGCEELKEESPSYFNTAEAKAIAEHIDKMSTEWKRSKEEFEPSTVCVVTFYKAQVRLIRQMLRKKELSVVRVESVYNIQGLEFDHFIISTVRTYGNTSREDDFFNIDMGFLTNSKLLNTALTRPKYSLSVFGDPVCLCVVGECKLYWSYFIDTCYQNNSYIATDKSFQQVVSLITAANISENSDESKSVDDNFSSILNAEFHKDEITVDDIVQLEKDEKEKMEKLSASTSKDLSPVILSAENSNIELKKNECVEQKAVKKIINTQSKQVSLENTQKASPSIEENIGSDVMIPYHQLHVTKPILPQPFPIYPNIQLPVNLPPHMLRPVPMINPHHYQHVIQNVNPFPNIQFHNTPGSVFMNHLPQMQPLVHTNHLAIPQARSIQALNIKCKFIEDFADTLKVGESSVIKTKLNSLNTQINKTKEEILFNDIEKTLQEQTRINSEMSQIYLSLLNMLILDSSKRVSLAEDVETLNTLSSQLKLYCHGNESPNIEVVKHCFYHISLIQGLLSQFHKHSSSIILQLFLKEQNSQLKSNIEKLVKLEVVSAEISIASVSSETENDLSEKMSTLNDQNHDKCLKEYEVVQDRKTAKRVPSPQPHYYLLNSATEMSPPYPPFSDSLLSNGSIFEGIISYKKMVILDSNENALHGVVSTSTNNLKFSVIGYRSNNRALPGDKVLVKVAKNSSSLPPTMITRGEVVKVLARNNVGEHHSCTLIKELDNGLLLCQENELGPFILIEKPINSGKTFLVKIIDWPLDSKYPLGKLVC